MMKGSLIQMDDEDGTDVKAVHSGAVSISAVQLDPSVLSRSGVIPEEAGIL